MRLTTRLRSNAMRLLASDFILQRRRSRGRKRRVAQGQAPTIYYFHQVDDPYSFIIAQQLMSFSEASSVPIKPFLVSDPTDSFKGDAARFDAWAMEDANNIAPFLGEPLPIANGANTPSLPDESQRLAAQAALAPALNRSLAEFTLQALHIGRALWRHEMHATPDKIAGTITRTERAKKAVTEGNSMRSSLGHYQSGTLYFDGEWYWGADRLPRLLERLIEEDHCPTMAADFNPYQHGSIKPLTVDTPVVDAITLEYFPSLRSPYSAIAHAAVEALIKRSGVNLRLRPVMPMLMRGVTAPRPKQQYIISDCTREARAKGIPFGNFVDPFGEPVRREFALFPGALAQGKGMAFIGAYLSGAFSEGIDIDSKRGLQQVVTNAELEWQATANHHDSIAWSDLLEDNVNAMLQAGLWGVPSFRISSPGEPDFCCWGQDRIWRVEHELARRSQAPLT